MPHLLRRLGRDLRDRRHLEAYAIAITALVLAVLSVVDDVVPDGIRWAALLSGVGLLVYRITLPETAGGADDLLRDRSAFDSLPFANRIRGAKELWIFAPSAVNLLSPQNCEAIRTHILSHREGAVRIVILDPDADDAVDQAAYQLDESVEYPTETIRPSLNAVIERLQLMSAWRCPGTLDYRFLSYNPGFSLVAINPGHSTGTVIVEFHGFHNESISGRMHVELADSTSRRWRSHWTRQFDHIWNAARPADRDSLEQPA